MFFYLSKLLYFFSSPLAWIILVMAVAVWNKKRRRAFAFAAFLLLLFFSNVFVFNQFAKVWEKPYISQAELNTKYQYGIVLSGMAIYRGDMDRLIFNKSADRLFQAVELYKKGKIEKIFLTGGSGSMLGSYHYESEYLKNYLLNIGIHDSVVVVEKNSRNTYENAAFTMQVLDSLHTGNPRCILITSAFHMRRSVACFKKGGLEPDIYPTDQYYQPSKSLFKDIFVPDVKALQGWNVLIHEWIGMVAYKMAGYI